MCLFFWFMSISTTYQSYRDVFSLSLTREGQLSVTGIRVHLVLVNHLGGLSLPMTVLNGP